MTPEQQELVMSLARGLGTRPTMPPDEFLRRFGATDGEELGWEVLLDAIARRDATDVEMALIISARFGRTAAWLGPLLELAEADWHYKHEDVVSELARFKSPAALDVLVDLTWWVPDYLDFDENRALARKAVWAIGAIPGAAAEEALLAVLESASEIVRDEAKGQMDRRRQAQSS